MINGKESYVEDGHPNLIFYRDIQYECGGWKQIWNEIFIWRSHSYWIFVKYYQTFSGPTMEENDSRRERATLPMLPKRYPNRMGSSVRDTAFTTPETKPIKTKYLSNLSPNRNHIVTRYNNKLFHSCNTSGCKGASPTHKQGDPLKASIKRSYRRELNMLFNKLNLYCKRT
jgi:hypothetical protein